MGRPCDVNKIPERLGKVGGQAVLDGVMMRSGSHVALAVRKPDGSIAVDRTEFESVRKRRKVLNWPVLRGVTNFVEMMILSYRTLMKSAEMSGIEEELAAGAPEEALSEEEKAKRARKAKGAMTAVEVGSLLIGLLLAVVLFTVLPVYAAKLINHLTPGVDLDSLFAVTSLIEGFFRILIFIGYLALVGLMPDMRRTFEYHGAEHKSVFCYEYGKDLIPSEAASCTRFHPRCGTSFLFVMLIVSILVGAFIPGFLAKPLRILIKLLLIPLIVGLGYEFIYYAGRHDNLLVRILSAPGLWMQRLTTREPDERQLEVALTALQAAMPEEYPDMKDVTLLPASPAHADPAAD